MFDEMGIHNQGLSPVAGVRIKNETAQSIVVSACQHRRHRQGGRARCLVPTKTGPAVGRCWAQVRRAPLAQRQGLVRARHKTTYASMRQELLRRKGK